MAILNPKPMRTFKFEAHLHTGDKYKGLVKAKTPKHARHKAEHVIGRGCIMNVIDKEEGKQTVFLRKPHPSVFG